MTARYRVRLADSAKEDIKSRKRSILEHFLSRDLAENFSAKIKIAIQKLDIFPTAYRPTEFVYRGYDIYLKPRSTYLIFYTVDEEKKTVTVLRVLQDGMNWKHIIKCWLQQIQ